MKKNNYIFIIIFLVIIIGAIIYFTFFNNNGQTNTDIRGSKISTDINIENTNTQVKQTPKEIQIATYSTQIKDNSPGRLTNIRITCGIINGTIINPGQTFSFNEIVGQPTAARGYQEAKIIINHETETGIGGGNCQVSSTIYNSVLAIPTLTVIERHEHGKDVTYVPEGKDAAVSYGSLDLKFRNDNSYKIKVNVTTDDKNLTATIFKIED